MNNTLSDVTVEPQFCTRFKNFISCLLSSKRKYLFEIYIYGWGFKVVICLWTDMPEAKIHLGAKMNPNDIEEGDDVYFGCKVDANPPAYKVVWEHNVSNKFLIYISILYKKMSINPFSSLCLHNCYYRHLNLFMKLYIFLN